MESVGKMGRVVFKKPSPVNGKKSFPHRIEHKEEGKPGRDVRVSADEENTRNRGGEAEKIGSSVPEEYVSVGVVPQKETEGRREHREAQVEKEVIPLQEGNVGVGTKNEDGDAGGESVEPVYYVKSVGDPSHRKAGEHKGHGGQLQQIIEEGKVHPGNRGGEKKESQRTGENPSQKAPLGSHAPGRVFEDPSHKDREGGDQKEKEVLCKRLTRSVKEKGNQEKG